MTTPIHIRTDVTEAAGLDGPALTMASVLLPDPDRIASPPVVVFAFPGAGYSRGYYDFDPSGSSSHGQAGYHVDNHGWIFVGCDHLGVGESSHCDAGTNLTFENVISANRATVERILALLGAGRVADGFPAVTGGVRIGLGQSMAACFTVCLQGRQPTFDGVVILGFSSIQNDMPVPPQAPALRDLGDLEVAAEAGQSGHLQSLVRSDTFSYCLPYAYHYADVPQEIVDADLTDYPTRQGRVPPWGSATIPSCAVTMLAPGIVAKEAAAIDVPVFLGVGEIDFPPDPRAEPSAYCNAQDITLFVVPRMAHMHNFAGTRTLLWDRIGVWGNGVARRRSD